MSVLTSSSPSIRLPLPKCSPESQPMFVLQEADVYISADPARNESIQLTVVCHEQRTILRLFFKRSRDQTQDCWGPSLQTQHMSYCFRLESLYVCWRAERKEESLEHSIVFDWECTRNSDWRSLNF
uniref:Uncharacterized protein n=1 Tax=Timema poppense TaxID=170557 RepID=A0A7R9H6L4_TIMPO|nr:unnamed protein product [Timema poppensis]